MAPKASVRNARGSVWSLRQRGAFPLFVGCRAVTVVSDSLYADNAFTQGEVILKEAANDTDGENHVIYTTINPRDVRLPACR